MRAPLLPAVARWSASQPAQPTHYASMADREAVYAHDDAINDRFAIWHGDISTLEVDAITNMTDETLSECNAVSERIMQAAGPDMKEEIVTRGLECASGSVVVTPGFSLPSRRVLHAAAPRYRRQYHSAADTSLHNCYSNILCAALELRARSLALSVPPPSRDYPHQVPAHALLRTIRRHLEQHSLPQVVVVCSPSSLELGVVASLAPLYFPRSPPEAAATQRLRTDVGDDRRIRIIHNPHGDVNSADDDAYDADLSVEAAALFARTASPDTQRLLPARTQAAPVLHSDQYERLLRRARTEDLSEVSGIGCLYQSGVDRLGRPVVVFIGKWFPISDINLDKALLYLIKLLDPIVRGDYVIAYFHTLASSTNHPPFYWLKEVYTVLPYKYKKNLKAFYIVHPTFWTKMMTWWFTTFMAPAIKAKVHNLPGVEYLYSVMARDQLEVPAFVTEYDMTINGLHYFQPDASST